MVEPDRVADLSALSQLGRLIVLDKGGFIAGEGIAAE